MGNSTAPNNQYEKLLSQHTRLAAVNDPVFGDIQIYQSRFDEQRIAVKIYVPKSNEEFRFMRNLIFQRIGIKHKNLLNLWAHDINDNSQLCQNFGIIKVVFENFKENLSQELEARFEKQTIYEEIYVWIFIQEMISVLSFLQEHNLYHGDIRPQNIYLSDKGAPVVADRQFLPEMYDGFQKQFKYRNGEALLSPEELDVLNQRNLNIKLNRQKTDVYSFGMTLLEFLTLQRSNQYYDYYNGKIDKKVLEEKLQTLDTNKYSHLLQKFVRWLLIADPDKRPDPTELKLWIKQYDDAINKMIPFWGTIEPPMKQSYILTSVPQRAPIQYVTVPPRAFSPAKSGVYGSVRQFR